MRHATRFPRDQRGSATVEFGVLAVAAGTVGLVASAMMAGTSAPEAAPDVTVAAAPAPALEISGITQTAYRAPETPEFGSSTAYRAFRVLIDGMDEDDLRKLYVGLPASLAVRREQGDADGAVEVLDAMLALDDSMDARGIAAPVVADRLPTRDLIADYRASLD